VVAAVVVLVEAVVVVVTVLALVLAWLVVVVSAPESPHAAMSRRASTTIRCRWTFVVMMPSYVGPGVS
jgi:hypothetical protein